MANEQILPWINSAGAGGERNSMVSFPCDGKRTAFEFNFAGGYIDRANIKAYTYEEYTGLTSPVPLAPSNFLGPNTLSITPAIPAGFFLVVYRDTQKTVPLVNYATGAVMDEKNLDMSNQQAVFVAAEMVDRFDAINASSADAIVRSVEAVRKADEALAASGQATSDASAALTAARQAVSTANEAESTADGIDGKATQAMQDGAAAVQTANAAKAVADTASATANGIDAKAQRALDNSVGATNIATNAQTVAQAANATANSASATANGIDAKAQMALDTVTTVFTSSRFVSRLRGGNTGRWVTSGARMFKFEWDWAVVGRSGANAPVAVPSGSVTVDLSTTGPGGWDVKPTSAAGTGFFYLITKADGTSSVVVSRSSSGPVLPPGYVAAMFIFLCALAAGTTYPSLQWGGELYGRRFSYTNMLTVVTVSVGAGSSVWTSFPLYGQELVEAHVGYARLYINATAGSSTRVVANLGYTQGIGSYVATLDGSVYAPANYAADNNFYTTWEMPGTCPIVLETVVSPSGGTSATITVFVSGYRVSNNAI